MKNIAIDISQIVYKGTGVANYTENLVKNLLRYDSENEYLLYGFSMRKINVLKDYIGELQGQGYKFEFKLINLPQTLVTLFWNKFHIFEFEKVIRKADLIHSSDWLQPPSKAKKITTVHDLVVYKFPEFSHKKIIDNQINRLRWVKNECNKIIVDSCSTREDLKDILNIESSRIEIIYPGVSDEFKPRNASDRKRVINKFNLSKDYILSVGTIEPRKNIKTVLNSYRKFINNRIVKSFQKPIELVIVGKTGWEGNVVKYKSVQFLGYVDNGDLPSLYSGASFFIYPSYYEGFGLPVLEAMSCGCPVICSDRGSLKEVIDDSVCLIDPENEDDVTQKMIKLYTDVDLKKRLVKSGYKNTERFSWKDSAIKLIKIYENILKN